MLCPFQLDSVLEGARGLDLLDPLFCVLRSTFFCSPASSRSNSRSSWRQGFSSCSQSLGKSSAWKQLPSRAPRSGTGGEPSGQLWTPSRRPLARLCSMPRPGSME
eukprot:9232301-Pyramimonas_sp.AAC.1